MKKLKKQYKGVWRYCCFRQRYDWHYPNLRNQYFSHFKTQQERSIYYLHKVEYHGYKIKLRPKRGKHLPHIWDDKKTYAYKYMKNWKHNSRRSHQWYREG